MIRLARLRLVAHQLFATINLGKLQIPDFLLSGLICVLSRRAIILCCHQALGAVSEKLCYPLCSAETFVVVIPLFILRPRVLLFAVLGVCMTLRESRT